MNIIRIAFLQSSSSDLGQWLETPHGQGKLINYYKNKQELLAVEIAFMTIGLDSIAIELFEGRELNSLYLNSKPLSLFWLDEWNIN